eukprot:21091_4
MLRSMRFRFSRCFPLRRDGGRRESHRCSERLSVASRPALASLPLPTPPLCNGRQQHVRARGWPLKRADASQIFQWGSRS